MSLYVRSGLAIGGKIHPREGPKALLDPRLGRRTRLPSVDLGQIPGAELARELRDAREGDARDHLVLGEERREGDERVDGDARDGARPEDVDALRARREVLPGDLN